MLLHTQRIEIAFRQVGLQVTLDIVRLADRLQPVDPAALSLSLHGAA
jgi:hypothetical protein